MVNKRFWQGILVMVLIFGMTVIGCDNGTTDSGTDSSLNGTWVYGYEEYKLDNGNVEMSFGGTLATKGTYSTSDGKITVNTTSIHGDILIEESDGDFDFNFESKWYHKDDLKTALEMSDEDIEEAFEDLFVSYTATYSVSGNTLTMTIDGGSVITATRK